LLFTMRGGYEKVDGASRRALHGRGGDSGERGVTIDRSTEELEGAGSRSAGPLLEKCRM